ncbi:hypothetical protein [Capnocytophaga ochracea]|uniref:hypothetical protein n=1 Tax=Capnocytophaga ochracea TaxID=1018 RepID=UPI002B478CD0|nr:hypothetical protein [Capnocytophaga ochracea]MEB3035807.1 hypothetical protein [Capnocytophaga ochracea]
MFLRRYILFFFTLLSFTLQAQQYPVDVQVFVTPPYPQSLRGYADTFEQKIQAHFLLKDLSTGGRPFVLRFSLEDFQGQTIAQTPDYITPYLVNLSPGVRRTLTNIDFKTLLRYENLYGINEATYNGLLPEGTYFIGLSLYDVATGRPVSNKGRAMIQVRRYSPPVLTMPQKGEVLTKKNAFQHIVFQWMPRDVAPFMQYEFTLKEVWDLALVPEEAFMTGRLVYQTKTFSPALAYTNMMPILLENKRYVWQVRAFTNNPNNPNEQSYFKNNGNSETFYFDLVSHCEAPKFLTAITESTSAQLRWSAQAMMPNQEYPYKVMYREKGKTWKSQKVSMPYAKLTNLKRGRTYIYKVGVACGLETAYSSSVFGEESYMYSTEQEFTTTEQIDEKSQVQCGVKPEIRIKNTNPLQDNLYPNTTFTAGDFPVTVLNATGNNGVYSGEGYVKVPYLQDTKIKVVFNGIKLNTERQLIDGKLVTTYDETERNVEFLQEAFGEIFGDKGKKDQKMPFEVSEVQVDTLGRITVIGKVDPKTGIAPKVTLPKGRDYVITDSKGKVYQLDESGKVTAEGTREEGTQLAQQAGKGDSKNPPINNKHFKVEWLFNDELANDTTGEIPYKALVKGKTSSFELRIQPADTTKYDFFFHTENGVKVDAESKGEGLYKITRKGAFDFAQEELWVVVKEKKDKKGKKEELIGKCILVHLSPKEVNVALVPTQSGQNLQAAIAQVQQIYEKVGVTLHITTEKPFDISDQLKNGTLPTENEFGDLSTYSPEQNAVIAKFTTNRKPKENTYYIFLVNDGTGNHGYMRLGGQYGFVYSTNARTIAHELGHGIFKLEHPFKGKNADKGKTSALMDYNDGQDFFYRDWKQINDPKVKLYAFQGQSEGEYKGKWLVSKILQQIRCYYLSEKNYKPISDSDLKYFDDLLPNDSFESRVYQVSLRGRSSYKVSVKFLISKNRKWNFPKEIIGGTATPPGMGAFTQYDFGKLQILTTHTSAGTDNYSFADYLSGKPLSQVASNQQSSIVDSSKDDIVYLEEVSVTGGYLEDGKIDDTEFEQLKNSAICGLAHFTPQERIGLIKALVKRSSREAEEDLILDILHNIPEGQEQEFLTKLSTEDKLLADLAYSLDDSSIFGGREDNRKRLINEILRIWGRTPFKEEAKQDIVVKKGKFDAHILKIEKGKIHFDLQYATPKVGLTTDKTLSAAAFEALDYIVVDKDNLKLENKRIPAFVAYILLNQRNSDAFFNYLSGYIDTYSFVIGLNSLKGIQEVPQAYRKLKTVIGGVEVGSATADIFLTYSEGCENEEVCQKLRQLIFAINAITLSADIYTSREIQQLAQETLESANRNRITLPNNIAEEVTRIAGKSISKLVEKLNLGKFIKKIGDYEVYENGEVFYRTMSKEHYDELLRTNKIRATGETTTSPNMAFSEGYEGILVQFKVKRGTIEKLENIGIASGNHPDILELHATLKKDISPWNEKYARFKLEKGQVNIALGKGEALKIFNDNILEFKFVKEIKK